MVAGAGKNKRDLGKERESEMAAIWGSEQTGGQRFPKRKGSGKKIINTDLGNATVDMDDVLSDADSNHSHDNTEPSKKKSDKSTKSKKEKRAKAAARYKLHCFVEPGTSINDVRQVFEAYEPKVDMKTSQKGNLLNKVHYAVLTFPNKPMALHAVQQLDGTNQRDLLGVTSLKLAMMLSRQQNKIARRKARKQLVKELRERHRREEEDDEDFVRKFMEAHKAEK